jgi:hypothetical protein
VTQEQSRQGILREWRKQGPPGRHSSYASRQEFFAWLVMTRPDLLAFRSEDKWQAINGWLLRDERQ